MAMQSISSINSGENPPNIIDFCKSELEQLLSQQPSFARLIEDEDPHACSRDELLDAMRSAPTPALRQHLFSVYEYRNMLTISTPEGF